MENKGDSLDTPKGQEIKSKSPNLSTLETYYDHKINNVIKNARNSAYNNLGNEGDTLRPRLERNKSQRAVCKHPDELLSEISDILLDSKISAHFMGKGETGTLYT